MSEKYWFRVYRDVPGTNTRWTVEHSEVFESDIPHSELISAVAKLQQLLTAQAPAEAPETAQPPE